MKIHEIKFFCDRCGKDFKIESGETSFIIKGQYTPMYRIENVNNDNSYLDLCKECKNSFIYWLQKEE